MNILYFSPIPYTALKQRPQYIAQGLSKIHNVVYVEPTTSIMKYILRGGEKPNGKNYKLTPSLQVLRLNGWVTAHRSFESISHLLCLSEQLQVNRLLKWADLVWIGYSPWFNMVRKFKGPIVYDKMDDNQGITQNALLKKVIEKTETQIIARADRVFVTAQLFYDEISPLNNHTFVINNAVDSAQIFPHSTTPIIRSTQNKQVFGYIGMIDHWFDIDAIKVILDSDNRNTVVLVGPNNIPEYEHPRLHYVGTVAKESVSTWIDSFDICLYPFRQTGFLNTIDPVKLYEYLAQNKPVLAADSTEIRRFNSIVYTYSTLDELQHVLKNPFSPPFTSNAQVDEFISQNNWDKRVADILSLL